MPKYCNPDGASDGVASAPGTPRPDRCARPASVAGSVLLGIGLLAGCSSLQGNLLTSTDHTDYRSVFAGAINRSLADAKSGRMCLPPLFGTGVMARESIEIRADLEQAPKSPLQTQALQFKALAEAGLVSATPAEREVNNRSQSMLVYRRTAQGDLYFSDGTFCYARATLGKLLKWKGPVVLGEYKAALVYYTAAPTEVADWARLPAVQAAFATVRETLQDENPKPRELVIDLSSEGWEVAEYSKFLQFK